MPRIVVIDLIDVALCECSLPFSSITLVSIFIGARFLAIDDM
jgi:hypothetical protein